MTYNSIYLTGFFPLYEHCKQGQIFTLYFFFFPIMALFIREVYKCIYLSAVLFLFLFLL